MHGDRERWLPRILPVLLPGHGVDEIPLFLQPTTATYYLVGGLTPAGAGDLLRVVLGQPGHVPPPVARPPVVPPLGSPAGWGGFDRLPTQVQGLLRAQELVAADLPYRLRGARPLRLRALAGLAELGTPGRQRAIDILTRMLNDVTLAATARARAVAASLSTAAIPAGRT